MLLNLSSSFFQQIGFLKNALSRNTLPEHTPLKITFWKVLLHKNTLSKYICEKHHGNIPVHRGYLTVHGGYVLVDGWGSPMEMLLRLKRMLTHLNGQPICNTVSPLIMRSKRIVQSIHITMLDDYVIKLLRITGYIHGGGAQSVLVCIGGICQLGAGGDQCEI